MNADADDDDDDGVGQKLNKFKIQLAQIKLKHKAYFKTEQVRRLSF